MNDGRGRAILRSLVQSIGSYLEFTIVPAALDLTSLARIQPPLHLLHLLLIFIRHGSRLSIALDDPGPELSDAVDVVDGDDGEADDDDRDRDGDGAEYPLVRAHVMDFGCTHTEE